jgi:cell division protein FtsL
MSKHKKSSRKQLSRVEKILLATAIANLINAVITLATEIIKAFD